MQELKMNPKNVETLHPQEDESIKKPYSQPQLFDYGAISEITRTAANRNTLDGGRGSTDKTS